MRLALHNFPLFPGPKLRIVKCKPVHALALDLQELVLGCRGSEANPTALQHPTSHVIQTNLKLETTKLEVALFLKSIQLG